MASISSQLGVGVLTSPNFPYVVTHMSKMWETNKDFSFHHQQPPFPDSTNLTITIMSLSHDRSSTDAS